MYQPGVGRKALMKIAKLIVPEIFWWGALNIMFMIDNSSDLSVGRKLYFITLILRTVVYGLFFGSTFCSSRIPSFRRRTLRAYAGILSLESAYMVVDEYGYLGSTSNVISSSEVHDVIFSLIVTARNVVIYWSMVRDTRYWLNDLDDNEMEEANIEVHTRLTDIRRPILGLSLEDGAGRMIGRQFDKFEPRDVIGHTELSLNMSQLIGHGGVSKVFSGMYRGEAVAIKLLFVPEISRSTVKNFFHEAAFLRSLSSHPNMVQLRGICVAPPALCHVLELCDGNVQSLITERRRKLGMGLERLEECDELFLSLGLP